MRHHDDRPVATRTRARGVVRHAGAAGPFATWLAYQVSREDDVGRYARAVERVSRRGKRRDVFDRVMADATDQERGDLQCAFAAATFEFAHLGDGDGAAAGSRGDDRDPEDAEDHGDPAHAARTLSGVEWRSAWSITHPCQGGRWSPR